MMMMMRRRRRGEMMMRRRRGEQARELTRTSGCSQISLSMKCLYSPVERGA